MSGIGQKMVSIKAATNNPKVDALILTALEDELDGVLTLAEAGQDSWESRCDDKGFRYFQRAFDNGRGGQLGVAVAWIGQMGPRAAAARAGQLIDELDPVCLAMCGICAGDRKKVSLGDVVVANRLYFYNEGKIIAPEEGEPQQLHDIRTFDLSADWKMDAQYFKREIDCNRFPHKRPVSKEAQMRWLLAELLVQVENGLPVHQRPDRPAKCPNWTEILQEARTLGLIVLSEGQISLTSSGREQASNNRVLYPDGLPDDPPFKVHVGAVGTGSVVQEDPKLFDRLRRIVRTTLGVDLEGAAIAEVAEQLKRKMLVVKAVSDFADLDKDDHFRTFACSASASVLLAFLLKHLDPTVMLTYTTIEEQYPAYDLNGEVQQYQYDEFVPVAPGFNPSKPQSADEHLYGLLRSFGEVKPYLLQSRWARISEHAPQSLVEQWIGVVEKLYGYQGHVVEPLCVAIWKEACTANLVPSIRALERRVDQTLLIQEYLDKRKFWARVTNQNLRNIGPRVQAGQAAFGWQSGAWPEQHALAGPLFELVWDILKGYNGNVMIPDTTVGWWCSAGGTTKSVPSVVFPWPIVNQSTFTADVDIAEGWNTQYTKSESYYLHIPDDERIADNLARWQVQYLHRIWHGPHVFHNDWKSLTEHMVESAKPSSGRSEYSEWAQAVPLLAAPESGLSTTAATTILEGIKPGEAVTTLVRKLRLDRARFCAPTQDPDKVIAAIDAEFADHPWVIRFGKQGE